MPSSVISGYSTGFFSVVGQIYDVNGRPSMVMSTRRCASSGTTCTPDFPAARSSCAGMSMAAARAATRGSLRIHLAPSHHLLRFVVEGDLLAGLNRGHIHAQRDGVAVPCLDR